MFTSCDSRAVHRCCVRRRATRASSLRCLHCQRQNLTRARTPCDRVRACTPGSWPRVGDHALPAPRRQVFGPRACAKRSEMKHDRCVLHCEISTASFSAGERRRQLRGDRRVLRLFPPHAPSSHAQGSSGVVATVPFAWRGHTKSTTARSGPSPDLVVWLESRRRAAELAQLVKDTFEEARRPLSYLSSATSQLPSSSLGVPRACQVPSRGRLVCLVRALRVRRALSTAAAGASTSRPLVSCSVFVFCALLTRTHSHSRRPRWACGSCLAPPCAASVCWCARPLLFSAAPRRDGSIAAPC